MAQDVADPSPRERLVLLLDNPSREHDLDAFPPREFGWDRQGIAHDYEPAEVARRQLSGQKQYGRRVIEEDGRVILHDESRLPCDLLLGLDVGLQPGVEVALELGRLGQDGSTADLPDDARALQLGEIAMKRRAGDAE